LQDLERARVVGWATLGGEVFVRTCFLGKNTIGTVVHSLFSRGIGRALEGEVFVLGGCNK